MARAAVLGRLIRQVAEVVAVIAETPLVTTIAFDVTSGRDTAPDNTAR